VSVSCEALREFLRFSFIDPFSGRKTHILGALIFVYFIIFISKKVRFKKKIKIIRKELENVRKTILY